MTTCSLLTLSRRPLESAWAKDVEAVLFPFLPGEQYGNALADLIFGDVRSPGPAQRARPLPPSVRSLRSLPWYY